mmetsp:Transcript_19267/g.48786  ORF Transcript_19267/g.48786 Transcript_19267/m.48786 type:complete len:253 (+) Transcript_19267:254-1012(+)
MSPMYRCEKPRAATLVAALRSFSILSRSCRMRRSFSSCRRLSASSILCASASSAALIWSNSSWCARILASSSSSSTSMSDCSSVLPTMTRRMGSTSKSKSNRSPSTICVSRSTPVFMGRKRGLGGRSMKGSVCVSISISAGLSAISSKKLSVWITACLLPATASGVAGRATCLVFCLCFNSRSFLSSASFCSATGSGTLVAGSTWAAYVLPRTTRRSHMMLTESLSSPCWACMLGSRYFRVSATALGCCAKA